MSVLQKLKTYFESGRKELILEPGLLLDTEGKLIEESVFVSALTVFLLVALIDDDLDERELSIIGRHACKEFQFRDSEALDIITSLLDSDIQEEQLGSLCEQIKGHFDVIQREHLLAIVWRVALADHKMLKEERRLIDRIASLLELNAGQVDLAKKEAKHQL